MSALEGEWIDEISNVFAVEVHSPVEQFTARAKCEITVVADVCCWGDLVETMAQVEQVALTCPCAEVTFS